MARTLDVLRFVGSIAEAPSVLLDLNDGVAWAYTSLDFSPPQLRRAVAASMLADGERVVSSTYANRVVTISLTLLAADADEAAERLQDLVWELDREANLLQFQPAGVSEPVFFRTLRCAPDVEYWPQDRSLRTLTVEIPAEPFAYGLRVEQDPVVVHNDPAEDEHGCLLDVTGVLGDVATPAIVAANGLAGSGLLAVRQHGSPTNLRWWSQAEGPACSPGVGTSNPAGAADTAMSGGSSTNYLQTTFADSSWQQRLEWAVGASLTTDGQRRALRGTYRVLAVVRRTSGSSTIQLRVAKFTNVGGGANVYNSTVATLEDSTARQVVDLGLVSLGPSGDFRPGRFGPEAPVSVYSLFFEARRTAGAASLQWDQVMIVPADEAQLLWATSADSLGGGGAALFDGETEQVWMLAADGDEWAGTRQAVVDLDRVTLAGGFPMLLPGRTNRLFHLVSRTAEEARWGADHRVTTDVTLIVSYYPRYLYVKPPTT